MSETPTDKHVEEKTEIVTETAEKTSDQKPTDNTNEKSDGEAGRCERRCDDKSDDEEEGHRRRRGPQTAEEQEKVEEKLEDVSIKGRQWNRRGSKQRVGKQKQNKLDYSDRNLEEKDFNNLPLGDASLYDVVDFSKNKLSSHQLDKVLEFCARCDKLRLLRLARTGVDDEVVERLADFIRKHPSVTEFHLSHNRFTAKGIAVLVKAADETRSQGSRPLWLRVDENDVTDPQTVIDDLKSKFSVCERKDANQCKVPYCASKCKVHLIILPRSDQDKNNWGNQAADGPQKKRRRGDDGSWSKGKDGNGWGWWDGYGGRQEDKWNKKEKPVDPMPANKRVKLDAGIFSRALSGALKSGGEKLKEMQEKSKEKPVDKDAPVDGEESEHEVKVVLKGRNPTTVASRTLGQLGLAGEKRRVLLKDRASVLQEQGLKDDEENTSDKPRRKVPAKAEKKETRRTPSKPRTRSPSRAKVASRSDSAESPVKTEASGRKNRTEKGSDRGPRQRKGDKSRSRSHRSRSKGWRDRDTRKERTSRRDRSEDRGGRRKPTGDRQRGNRRKSRSASNRRAPHRRDQRRSRSRKRSRSNRASPARNRSASRRGEGKSSRRRKPEKKQVSSRKPRKQTRGGNDDDSVSSERLVTAKPTKGVSSRVKGRSNNTKSGTKTNECAKRSTRKTKTDHERSLSAASESPVVEVKKSRKTKGPVVAARPKCGATRASSNKDSKGKIGRTAAQKASDAKAKKTSHSEKAKPATSSSKPAAASKAPKPASAPSPLKDEDEYESYTYEEESGSEEDNQVADKKAAPAPPSAGVPKSGKAVITAERNRAAAAAAAAVGAAVKQDEDDEYEYTDESGEEEDAAKDDASVPSSNQ